MQTNLFGMDVAEIAAATQGCGLEKYRAGQIARWMYQRGTLDFRKMTDLPAAKRELLVARFCLEGAEVQTALHSADGKTHKYLLGFADGAAVETVLMRQPYGNSVCVSTQVGCAMGCAFCASTLHGLTRNLTGGEIMAQVLHHQETLQPAGGKVDSIVIMGMGEPLANYDNVLRFIRLCHAPYCLNMSYRSITLSTSGLVSGMDRLAGENLPITLSVSLHAPNDALRSRLMPVNRRYPLAAVLAAGDRYAGRTGRRVTYEYTLMAGVNDSPEHARELAALLRGRLANVNLIPVNPVPESGWKRPAQDAVAHFEEILRTRRIAVTVRREMGADIQAACGQLRNKTLAGRDLVNDVE